MTTPSETRNSGSAPATGPASGIRAARRRYRDFDELAEAILGWGLDWVQLDRGTLEAELRQIATPGAQLDRFRFSRRFHQRGYSPRGVRTFGFLPRSSPPLDWRGNSATSDHLVVFPADSEFELISQSGFCGDTVSVSEDRLLAFAESCGFRNPFEGIPNRLIFLDVAPRWRSALQRLVSRVHSDQAAFADGAHGATAVAELEADVVSTLAGTLLSRRHTDFVPVEPKLRARALSRALERIEEGAHESPRVQDLCSASGASWRTLDYAFKDRFGVSPKQYLQSIRLRGVRRMMHRARPGATIVEIANQWGFWHMGKFAADYRRHFGELPSATLRRAASPARSADLPAPAGR